MPGTAKSGGRNRKSAAEHALTGSGRADRGTLASSTGGERPPDPPKGRPPIPVGLIGPALEEWTRMVARLEQAQTLTVVDDAALYQYCCLFAETEAIAVAQHGTVALLVTLQAAIDRWKRLVERLEKEEVETIQGAIDLGKYGDRIVDATAQIVALKKLEAKYPTQLRQGHMAMRQYLVEFGMTPAARSRVQPSPDAPTPASPIDRFTKPRP